MSVASRKFTKHCGGVWTPAIITVTKPEDTQTGGTEQPGGGDDQTEQPGGGDDQTEQPGGGDDQTEQPGGDGNTGNQDDAIIPGANDKDPIFTGDSTKIDDKVKNPTEGMTGEVFDKDGNKIDGAEVTVDPKTGEITVKLPEDAPVGKGTVQVKDKDGNPVGNPINVEVVENPIIPGANDKDPITPGDSTKIDDKVKNPTEGMTGEVFDKNGNKIEGARVTVDPKTGEITVKLPENAPIGDATVQVKDKDGNNVGNPINVEIVEKSNEDTKSAIIPGDNDKDPITQGEATPIDDKVTNPTEGMTGEVFDKDGNKIEGAEVTVDPNTGEITVKVPENTPTGDATVQIKDKDGNNVGDPINVEIVAPKGGDDATAIDPAFDKDGVKVKPGESGTTNKPFEGKNVPAITEAKVTEGTDGWDFKIDDTTGVITGQAPSEDALKNLFDEKFPEGRKATWDDFAKEFAGVAKQEVTGSITFAGETDPRTGNATFYLVGKDGEWILDPTGDFDGDGVSNADEVKDGDNPFKADQVVIDQSGKQAVKEGLKKNQDTGVTVKFPEGKKPTVTATEEDGNAVAVEITDDGKLQVNPDKVTGQDGKPAKVDGPITVTITDDKGKATKVEIEVIGEDGNKHAKGVDDNGNGFPKGNSNSRASLTEDEKNRCIAAGVGFGLPLLALIPLGIALTVGIPGLEDQVAQFNANIERANTELQKQLGIFNPQMAAQAAEVNAQLKEYGMNLLTGAGALLLIPLIIGNALGIAGACTPGDMSSISSSRD